ncbi:MAG: hypothetical protein PHW78_02505 [Macromonas bipunctata]|nr:hypothetical protein [Macromonas bipunctata]
MLHKDTSTEKKTIITRYGSKALRDKSISIPKDVEAIFNQVKGQKFTALRKKQNETNKCIYTIELNVKLFLQLINDHNQMLSDLEKIEEFNEKLRKNNEQLMANIEEDFSKYAKEQRSPKNYFDVAEETSFKVRSMLPIQGGLPSLGKNK